MYYYVTGVADVDSVNIGGITARDIYLTETGI